jgi:Rha family phage regulatory protein
VADRFKKRHDLVLRDIETKIFGVAPKEFTDLNFEETKVKSNSNRMNKCYAMTRDGFLLLSMGFTGKKAMKWKVDLIQLFDAMEEFMNTRQETLTVFPLLCDAIKDAHTEPKPHHYSNEFNMLDREVLGMTSKDFRKAHGIVRGGIRDHFDPATLKLMDHCQKADWGMFIGGLDYQQRKAAIHNYCAKFRNGNQAELNN